MRLRDFAIAAFFPLVVLSLLRCSEQPVYFNDDTGVVELVRTAVLLDDGIHTAGANTFGYLDAGPDVFACYSLFDDPCTNGVRNFSYTSNTYPTCTTDSGLTFDGNVALTFDNPTCDTTGAFTMIRKTKHASIQRNGDDKRYMVYVDTDTIAGQLFVTADTWDYNDESRIGGTVLTSDGVGGLRLTARAVHHRSYFGGSYGFHHTLYTGDTQGLDVVVAGAQHTLNGTFSLAHNRAKILYTVTATGLTFETGCRYPTAGQLYFEGKYLGPIAVPTATPTITHTPVATPTGGVFGATPTPTTLPTATHTAAPTATSTPIPAIQVDFQSPCGSAVVDGATIQLLP